MHKRILANTRLHRSWMVAAGVLAACSPHEGSDPARIQMASPRDYGYVIGDVVHQTLDVDTPGSEEIDPGSLPPAGPMNEWLTVLGSHVEVMTDSNPSRSRVVIDYQIFKAVRAPEQVTLPPLSLRLNGKELQNLASPLFNVHINPVIPQTLQDEEVTVRDPMPPLPVNASKARTGLAISVLALSLALGLWGLRRWILSRRVLPFSASQSRFRSALSAGDRGALEQGLRLMHRALDQTQGHTLFHGQLEAFLNEHPRFGQLDNGLREFFRLSEQVFFDQTFEVTDIRHHTERLRILFDQCQKAERRT